MNALLLEDLRLPILELAKRLQEVRGSLDVVGKEERIALLEDKMAAPGFWDDPGEAQKVAQELTGLKDNIAQYYQLQEQHEDVEMLWQLGSEEQDESVYAEIQAALQLMEKELETLQLDLMLSGEYDRNNAILTLHAGAGGWCRLPP